jgi:hypothetical protein
MILFESCWDKFPTAIADLETPNQSFVRMAKVFKSMGVRNHLFHLSLLNPSLQGVDPFSHHLTEAQMVAIGLEVRYNPWYYLREVARLKPQGGSVPVQIEANRGNIGLYWSTLNHIDTALIQPRQTGKSVNADSLSNWIIYFGAINTNMALITKNDELRRANIERLKEMRKLLPAYLLSMSKEDPNNQFEIKYSRLNNYFRTAVAQSSEASAQNIGRGMTTPWLQSDEGPFTNMIRYSLPAALASGTAAREEAERNGRPYANLFTTTAGRRDHPDGKFMYELIHNGAEWNESFYDSLNCADAHDRVFKAGIGERTLVNITLSAQQLGKTDEWLRRTVANAGGTKDSIERDFFNIWTSGTLSSPLSIQLNEAIRNSEMDPVWVERTPAPTNYMFNWYRAQPEVYRLMEEQTVVLGLDTSDAIGRDAIVLVATHPETAEVLGVGRYNETNLMRFAKHLLDFMIQYPRTVLIPERRSSAQAIIDFLLMRLPAAGIDPFRRIYNRIVDQAIENPAEYRELSKPLSMRTEQFYDERKRMFGLATTAESREALYGPVLQQAARRAGDVVRSRSLSTEIRGLVVKDGRIDHKAGGHDDAVVSWLMTHWLLMNGRNLAHYGIDPARMFNKVVQVGEVTDPLILDLKRRRDGLTGRVAEMIEQIADCQDDMVAMKLEFALRALHAQLRALPGGEEEIQTIDGLLQRTRDERRKRRNGGYSRRAA